MKIELTDNNRGQNPVTTYDRESIAALFELSDVPISELCHRHENLLVFPHCLSNSPDDIDHSSIISIRSTSDPYRVSIETGNIMGFISVGGVRVKIKSRFDSGRDDYFLHYMLQRVMHFNLLDWKYNNDTEEAIDLIMFLFPLFLKRAMRQGIYREYRQYEHNDSNVRGPISTAAHLKRNTPFAGKVAYTTREFSYDNHLTQLIRHTIEYMQSTQHGKAILRTDTETQECICTIVQQTPSYNRGQRSSVVHRNLRHKVHPFYTEYSPLRVLCLQILRTEELRYGDQDDEVYGILFDGAWLWEEYVGTVLTPVGFEHPKNKLSQGTIHLFDDNNHKSGRRYPDFYKKDIVVDAKYKRLSQYDKVSKVDRNDIHQVIAYMVALKATRGGFVVPLDKKQTNVPTSHLANTTNSTISIFGIEVSKQAEYSAFANEMTKHEMEFVQTVE